MVNHLAISACGDGYIVDFLFRPTLIKAQSNLCARYRSASCGIDNGYTQCIVRKLFRHGVEVGDMQQATLRLNAIVVGSNLKEIYAYRQRSYGHRVGILVVSSLANIA